MAPEAWEKATRASEARSERSRDRVYGASTGGGTNRTAQAAAEESVVDLRPLLCSHRAGVGPVESAGLTRAALTIRLAQLLAGSCLPRWAQA
ncbi:aromatic amino acid lyase [Streptomyces atratus]|uniref:aromatic amino acid lyase n=1 Tax=Streptomyces atratus TaxID=1893 RepID=UPI0033F2B01B